MTFADIAAQTKSTYSTVYRDYRSALAKMGLALEEVPRRCPNDTAKKLALS